MKKLALLAGLVCCLTLSACHKQTEYDRNDPNQDYERFINSHVFAACEFVGKPYARYSLAKLLQRPANDTPYYKVTFTNGPCKGATVWTTEVLLKTQPVDDPALLPTGTVVLRNFDNPKEPYDKSLTDHWNLAVIMDKSRANKGVVDLGFPRDKNDFFPARESAYIHNIRVITKPQVKDVRQFIN